MYQLSYIFLAGLFLFAGGAVGKDAEEHAQENESKAQDKKFAIAPMISSNPSMGTGLGFNASYLYQADEQSRPSQLMVGGQYTSNDSYNLFVLNNASFKGDTIRSVSFIGNWHVNNSFSNSCDTSAVDCDPNADVKYSNDNLVAGQRLMFDVGHNIWLGGGGFWGRNIAEGQNDLGSDFVSERDMGRTNTAGLFLAATYDSRDNRFYPLEGTMIEISPSFSMKALGGEYNSKQLRVDARHYVNVNQNDVIALQSVANIVEKGVPVSGQSFLGRNNVLRGFSVGEYMGEELYAAQAEYRHHISEKWKLVGFGGVGTLRGETARRFDNDILYYSAGAGVRYAIQPQAKVHFRFDFAVGNEDNNGFYVGIQEAF
ncbi:BamA/TamA family outer membrane protein [Thaumasiovibrio sp. DFM-14]|uniref:BamA/TamA family outer membrane protein n=1 Tax=Thaumasiovibrio sp. DFM-14 TaxID=3384792 RepID=UPI0039A089B2